jgi:hypothetical protein
VHRLPDRLSHRFTIGQLHWLRAVAHTVLCSE